jgi:hypothetical protein
VKAAARRTILLAPVALGTIWVAWLGFRVQTTGDYTGTFAPAMNALLAGRVQHFFSLLPDDGAGGSLLLRAPGALVGKLIGGTELSTFRFGALECTAAAAALGVWLAARSGAGTAARAATVAVCVLAPALLDAIYVGHPEEVLGAVLCVAAVLLAQRGPVGLAGIVLGLAIVNKPWGLLAIAPALIATDHPARTAAVAAAVCGTWLGLALLFAPGQLSHSLSMLSIVAHPEELWWPLARQRFAAGGIPVQLLPTLVSSHARELAVMLALPLALPTARRGRRSGSQCLALLALLLLVRCVLDPSDQGYYHVPFVLALVAWETLVVGPPIVSLATIAALWLVFHGAGIDGDLLWVAYMAIVLPLAAALAAASHGRLPRRADRRRTALAPPAERGRYRPAA